MTEWFVEALEKLLNALELESVEWLFDEEKHPTLAAVEDRYFTYISNMIQRLQAYRTKEVRCQTIQIPNKKMKIPPT